MSTNKVTQRDIAALRVAYSNRWYPMDPIDKGEISTTDFKRLVGKGLMELDGYMTMEGCEAIGESYWD